jgi:hypothetical protein
MMHPPITNISGFTKLMEEFSTNVIRRGQFGRHRNDRDQQRKFKDPIKAQNFTFHTDILSECEDNFYKKKYTETQILQLMVLPKSTDNF